MNSIENKTQSVRMDEIVPKAAVYRALLKAQDRREEEEEEVETTSKANNEESTEKKKKILIMLTRLKIFR
jgi:cell division protein FtsA